MPNEKTGLTAAISSGIGGMVGGGIFAVLGLAADLARGATPAAFLVAGLIALVTAYSYAHLSLTYPDRGGTVRFVNEGFGRGIFSGGVGFLFVFAVVNYTGFRKSTETGSNRAIPLAGCIMCTIALGTLLVQQYQTERTGVLVVLGTVGSCFLLELACKRFGGADAGAG